MCVYGGTGTHTAASTGMMPRPGTPWSRHRAATSEYVHRTAQITGRKQLTRLLRELEFNLPGHASGIHKSVVKLIIKMVGNTRVREALLPEMSEMAELVTFL